MIVVVKNLIKELKKFKADDIIEIKENEIVFVNSAHLKKRKVSESEVFSMAAMKLGSTEIAKKFGVSKQYINDILAKRKKLVGDL